ncbi:MAG: xanthine dehydrogenase accessory protein XdhC [Firmicutes bacterium]|nr:xanthine dehydrogenase accessory protein XdhC [Bacillota bacterium]
MNAMIETIQEYLKKGEDLVLAVVTETSGSTPRGKGAAMLVGREGLLAGTVGGGALEGTVLSTAQQCLNERRSDALFYSLQGSDGTGDGMICGGTVSVLLQFLDSSHATLPEQVYELLSAEPLQRAIIFGGGHIAAALAPILKSVDFRVIVMDERPEFTTNERFPDAAQVVCGSFGDLSDLFTFGENDYAVVVTSGHQHDFEVEEQILRHELAYIGVIGSRKKTAAVNAKLREAGITEEQLAKVHTPIGLDIGAETPEEIAVSIAAEMIQVRAERRMK